MPAFRRQIPDPAEFQIPALDDDAAWADGRSYREAVAELQLVEARYGQAQRRADNARLRARGVPAGRSSLERAKDLIAGKTMPATDPGRELEAASAEMQILHEGIRDAHAKIEDIRAERSYALATRWKPHHNASLRAILDAFVVIDDALTTIRGARARRVQAGYTPCDYVLAEPVPAHAIYLGDPRAMGTSAAGVYRAALEELGVIKRGAI